MLSFLFQFYKTHRFIDQAENAISSLLLSAEVLNASEHRWQHKVLIRNNVKSENTHFFVRRSITELLTFYFRY